MGQEFTWPSSRANYNYSISTTPNCAVSFFKKTAYFFNENSIYLKNYVTEDIHFVRKIKPPIHQDYLWSILITNELKAKLQHIKHIKICFPLDS